MKNIALLLLAMILITSCDSEEESPERIEIVVPNEPDPVASNFDFSDWKVTLPVDVNNDGSPDEYAPSQLDNGGYRTLSALDGYMYDDPVGEGIIFYTQFDTNGATTANSSYPRTELRELINPSNSRDNWSLQDGGVLKVRMQALDVSDNTGTGSLNKDRFIMAQIHGIITPSDVARLNLSSDSAPPLLKMQWRDGDLYAYKKTLENESMSGDAIINKDDAVWGDISYNFGQVGFEPFDLEIRASTGRLEVIVDGQSHVFQDISLAKWPFDNYFKAGNYIQTTDPTGYSKVKLYSIEVSH
ncbi:polysaccharide lyase family 7 protein [Nonlabens ulvanivorans]|uniref:polysaccharide lyase family 7 protein n=1 Tax=Nonlabens ulvanivorans TaxID=906888 RepID=UPI0037C8C5AB